MAKQPAEILEVVLREMCAIGQGWRLNWSDFDGRTLRSQLNELARWVREQDTADFTKGTEFQKEQEEPY